MLGVFFPGVVLSLIKDLTITLFMTQNIFPIQKACQEEAG